MERNKNDIYLPNDVVIEILLRLPSKSLGLCKCVSRTWYNLIENPNFITDHFHHPRNPTRLFAVIRDNTRSEDDHVFTLFSDESLSLRQDIGNPITDSLKRTLRIEVILGPVSGLFFMSYSYNDSIKVFHHALWNPSTSEFRELPWLLSSQQRNPEFRYRDKYFGFGSTGEDMKVVSITNVFRVIDMRNSVLIRLYSLKDDFWKDIQYDSARFPFIANGAHPFYNDKYNHLNGVCYWVVTTDHDILFLFDLKSEEFREVNLPTLCSNMFVESICVRDNSSIVLFVNQFLVSSFVIERVDLWEMKEEGEWFKLMSFDPSSTSFSLEAVCYGLWKRDEILVKANYKKVVLYNMNSHEVRDLEIGWSHRIILLNYKESLTSVRREHAMKTIPYGSFNMN